MVWAALPIGAAMALRAIFPLEKSGKKGCFALTYLYPSTPHGPLDGAAPA